MSATCGYRVLGVCVVIRILGRRFANFLGDARILPFTVCFGSGYDLYKVLPLISHIEGVAEAASYLKIECCKRCGGRVARCLIVAGIRPPSVEVELRAVAWSLAQVEFV